MPALTQDCWHVYYGDVHVGTIARRVGCPQHVDQLEWRCGFYPGIQTDVDKGRPGGIPPKPAVDGPE